MSKIESLTPEQTALIPKYREEFLKIGLSTEPCDRAKAEAAFTNIYIREGKTSPEFFWVDSPEQGLTLAAKFVAGSEDVTQEQIQEQYQNMNYGSFDAYWVSTYSFIANELPVDRGVLIDDVVELSKHTGTYWLFDDAVIIAEKPVEIHLKDKNLHNEDGLALKYKDGSGTIAINGVKYKSLMEAAIAAAAGTNEKA